MFAGQQLTKMFLNEELYVLFWYALLPTVGIYSVLMLRKQVSRWFVFFCGVILIACAVITLLKLGALNEIAKQELPPTGYKQFAIEYRLALYVLPFLCAGVGTNLITHTLIVHLRTAEKKS